MGYKKGLNKYKIIGNITILYIVTKDDTYETLIDTVDLDRLKKLNLSFTIRNLKHRQLYVRASNYLGKINGKYKYETIYLHAFISNANFKQGDYVDHKNHNTLDNRKENLVVTNQSENLKNRGKINKNNKSGYRNVSWSNKENKWLVQLQINKKNTCLGKFDNVYKAGEFAKEMRKKYYN
jgi:hypothetical protein